MRTSNYPKAVKYLAAIQREGINGALGVLSEIAAHNPKIVVQAFERCFSTVNTNEAKWEMEILKFAQNNLQETGFAKKIHCIKLYRELSGLGLKESKDAVEKIFAKYNIVD